MDREYKNFLRRCRYRRPEVKAKQKAYVEKYKETHPDYLEKKRESDRRYYEANRTIRMQKIAYFNARSCRDPVAGDVCKYNTLVQRKRKHPDWYEGVVPRECLIKVPTIKGLDPEEMKKYNNQ